MPERHQIIPRTLCLVMKGNKILLIEYSEKKQEMQGLFNAPGGHIEYGEGIIENAEKEIFEETGLKVSDTHLKGVLHAMNFFGKNVILFVTTSQANTTVIRASDEGKIHWIDLDKLNSINLIKDVKIIIEKINQLGNNETFTAVSEFNGQGKLLKLKFE